MTVKFTAKVKKKDEKVSAVRPFARPISRFSSKQGMTGQIFVQELQENNSQTSNV